MRKQNTLIWNMAVAISVGGCLAGALPAKATEDYEVNRTSSRLAPQYKEGEVIVKIKGKKPGVAPARVRAVNGKVSSTSNELEAFLRDKGLVESVQLMGLSGGNVAKKFARGFNGRPVADSDLSGLYAFRFNSSHGTTEIIEELKKLEEVEYAEPNYIVYSFADPSTYSSDPLYGQQWGIGAIGLDKLWQVPLKSSKRPVIAILDTGVDISHPDLADNIWTNPYESDGAEGSDDDGNGYSDDIHGWDFVNNSARMRDNNGHGTHCAGIAAASGGNGVGISGANPDALIMPITVMQSNGTGDVATIIKGIDYAAANGADVISMSFGTYSNSLALSDALGKAYQKSILVASAGNDSKCIYPHRCPINKEEGSPSYPAAYSFVLGVEASSNADGALASFSNFDEDGPITSTFADLSNYEIRAPGVSIMSTFPGGQYRALNGTSMSCPLVAGALSRLISVKDISSKEELFGDLIHTANGNIDIYAAFNLSDADRKPTLSLVTYRLDDEKMGDGDGIVDAGETIRLYPTFRNAWGNARNIKYTIKLAETEDPEIVEFMDFGDTHMISQLSSYATAEAENPFILKINPNCADGRIICFELEATCDNMELPLKQEIQLTVENGIELGGVISEDMTLYPDKNYIVTSKIAVGKDATLTILPGTVLKFKNNTGIECYKGEEEWTTIDNRATCHFPNAGKIYAHGTPKNKILFIGNCSREDLYDITLNFGLESEIEYCEARDISGQIWLTQTYKTPTGINVGKGYFTNVIVNNCKGYANISGVSGYSGKSECGISNFYNCDFGFQAVDLCSDANNVIRNNGTEIILSYHQDKIPYNINCFSNYNRISKNYYSIGIQPLEPCKIYVEKPSYFGTSAIKTAQSRILDIRAGHGVGELDLSNMRKRPLAQAHGIVWKVVVNDYDAQDEYDWLAPLGVGRHKFEVYFNRKMNHEKTPFIAMGVREPYTQVAISEDGEWRTETFDGEEVDVYTVYLTIKGKDNFDGVNTIYVSDAEDDEFFEIPIEDVRFHVNVQSAGSMSTGFAAEAGVGKVTLTWENPEENFDDMLGYNMYRYTLDENGEPTDAVKINEQLLTEESLIDYDIVPGTTYCYYYKVLRTSLTENAPSKIVSATPRAARKGDANGSGDVDVADVVTEVNYMVGHEPKPFIFDAADVNTDSEVDILDVVGTVNIILMPTDASSASVQTTASYEIVDDILYVDSPVELAGVQVEFSGIPQNTEVTPLEALKGMESAGDWINDNDYRFLAFSLTGKTIVAGRTPLLSVKNADLKDIRLVDAAGNSLIAMAAENTGISAVVGQQMTLPSPNPFHDILNVPVKVGTPGMHDVKLQLTDLSGRAHLTSTSRLEYGEHDVRLNTPGVADGIYLLVLYVDGHRVQTCKVIRN